MHKKKDAVLSGVPLGRRSFVAGAAALTAGIATCLRPAFADTQVVWVGWQGYDEPLKLGHSWRQRHLAGDHLHQYQRRDHPPAGGRCRADRPHHHLFGHLVAADLLEPIDESKLPGIKDVFPEFLNVDPIRRDGKLYAMPFTWGTLSMIYDPAAAPKPTSWKDCLKEEFKGKVSLVDDATGLLATWAPIVTGTKTPTRITMDELKKTVDFLIEIKNRCPHARQLLWRGDRHVRARRGGHIRSAGTPWWVSRQPRIRSSTSPFPKKA
jgi:hypothetical protein